MRGYWFFFVQDGKYAILMVDADAPSAKAAKCRYWLHWATADVDGRHLRNGVNWMNGEGKIIKGQPLLQIKHLFINKGGHYMTLTFSCKLDNP